jgi:predicted ferric reductase
MTRARSSTSRSRAVAEARRLAAGAAIAGATAAAPALALTDRHLDGASAALVASTVAAAVAVPLLALQPLLAGTGRIRRHRLIGALALALVLAHVAALFAESPEDARFALSPDGPTRARMALFATIALMLVVALGALKDRLPIATGTWRVLHAYLAAVAIVLGIGHAVLTDGALDGAGTVVLLALGAAGVLGVPAAHVARTRLRSRAARPLDRARARSGA